MTDRTPAECMRIVAECFVWRMGHMDGPIGGDYVEVPTPYGPQICYDRGVYHIIFAALSVAELAGRDIYITPLRCAMPGHPFGWRMKISSTDRRDDPDVCWFSPFDPADPNSTAIAALRACADACERMKETDHG